MLEVGQELIFVKNEVITGEAGSKLVFSSTLPEFVDEVKPGERILLDDGNVSLESLHVSGEGESKVLHCRVISGGLITTAKGINLPDTELSLPSMTEKDFRCAESIYRMKNGLHPCEDVAAQQIFRYHLPPRCCSGRQYCSCRAHRTFHYRDPLQNWRIHRYFPYHHHG